MAAMLSHHEADFEEADIEINVQFSMDRSREIVVHEFSFTVCGVRLRDRDLPENKARAIRNHIYREYEDRMRERAQAENKEAA